jgi:hypothetical protein
MKTHQHGILALAVGATLALGASTANARIIAGNGLSAGTSSSASSHYSAAALKALDLRWEGIAKSYRQTHSVGVRPDDRPGPHGA